MHVGTIRFSRSLLALGTLGALLLAPLAHAAEERDIRQAPVTVDAKGTISPSTPIKAEASAVVNFGELARQAAPAPPPSGPPRTWMPREFEPPPEPYSSSAPAGPVPGTLKQIMAPSPGPSSSYMGLDDIAMADSLYIVIPPDIAGAVGPAKVMESFNNNYRIRDKGTGATLSTVGTATFWAPVVAASERLSLTDPRTLYDPYNNRWIVEMQTVTSGAGKILVGVSQTSDPSGSWYLYSFNTGVTIDFPIVGFNKNWISVAINRYSSIGVFQRGINLIVNYPSARVGTGTGTIVTQLASTHFCSAPCPTYSPIADTLYVVTHLSSTGATYELDTITGTSAAPVYTSGGSFTRTGGAWVQPGGNQLPQSAPNSGSSACGATPCPIEAQDSQIRSAPVYRGGYVYYAQTVGLPSGSMTHTGVQWTKIAAPGGVFSDGGRIEDATATSTNGGKWYAFAHIAVNSVGDFIVGYTQFSSAQHPSAGYSVHSAGDAAGTIRDPLIYHAGEDYYHKTFSTATGRNRWGDFGTAQVDPSDDQTLWTLQEYAKTRVGTDDGNTGSNSSRWSSWWAGVSAGSNFTITASAGPGGSITPSGNVSVGPGANQNFTITPAACYHVADVLVDGSSVGPVSGYTFNNVQANHTIAASFALTAYTVTASAGANGSISPSGALPVNCGANQAFNIIPAGCAHVANVLVDGSSVGPVTGYTFNNVQANHTISASFAVDVFTLATSVAGGGVLLIAPRKPLYDCGDSVKITATANPGWAFDHWAGDAGGSANPLEVVMNAQKSIIGVFLDIAPPTVTVTSPNGGEVWLSGSTQSITWTAADNVGVVSVDLAYSTDGGLTYPYTVATGVANSGSYSWVIPGTETLAGRVQATAHDAAANAGLDASDANFEIQDPLAAVAGTLLGAGETAAVHPNPASAGTVHVLYRMPRAGAAEVSVFDVAGHQVRRLASGAAAPGVHDLRWDGRDDQGRGVGAGIYLVRVNAGKQAVLRLVLVR